MKVFEAMIYFNAGPAKIPDDVLQEVRSELLDYAGTGLSVMEISHRSKTFADILAKAEKTLRSLLDIPEDYAVMFMQGGATGQFAAVPLNLKVSGKADYIITGTWSKKAAAEAKNFTDVRVVYEDKLSVPDQSSLQLNPKADYVYYCDNETIEGVEFGYIPETSDVPLVADMSSNLLTRRFDIKKFGVIFAGAQKNLGTSGVTLVIARQNLLARAASHCPSILNYSILHKTGSVLNTPPCFSIYVLAKVLVWTQDQGGVDEMEKRCRIKSQLIYGCVEKSNGFYLCPVKKCCRSRTTVRITLFEAAKAEEEFLQRAQLRGLTGLKGHRSVGGLRAALFNSISIAQTETLAEFMEEFERSSRALGQ